MDPLIGGVIMFLLGGGAVALLLRRHRSKGSQSFEHVVQEQIDEARRHMERAATWARALRSHPEARDAYLLAMTTLTEVEKLLQAVEANPDDFSVSDLHIVGVQTLEKSLQTLVELMPNAEPDRLKDEVERTTRALEGIREGFIQKREELALDDSIVLKGQLSAAGRLTGGNSDVDKRSSGETPP